MQRRTLAAAGIATALLAATAATVVANAGAASDPSAGLTNNWYASAPYLMPVSNNPPDPTAVMAATGQKAWRSSWRPAAAAARRPGTAPTRSPRTPRSPV